MNTTPRSDRIIRAGAWLYVLPRAAKGILLLAVFGLAGFMVITAIVLNLLRRLG